MKADIFPSKTDQVITISNLLDKKSIYNINPPYQRGNVWNETWKQDLIDSIFKGLPLAPLTLVEKDNDGELEYLVLDGKQRLSSVLDFTDNSFSVNICYDNKTYYLKYKDLEQASKDKKHNLYKYASKLYSNFKNYNFKAVIYPDISWDTQIHLFEKINHSKSLSADEKFNSKFIFAKLFVDFVFETYIQNWEDYVSDKKHLTRDGKDTMWKFRLIGGLIGTDLSNPIVNIRNFPADKARKEFERFMQSLNKKIENYMIVNDDQYLFTNQNRVEKMFESFNWSALKKAIENFKNCLDIFSNLDFEKNLSYNLVYFSLFIVKNMQENTITYNMLQKEKDSFKLLYKNYYDWAVDKSDSARISRAGSLKGRDVHISKIEELFALSNLDLGKKNQKFSAAEKQEALNKAENKCEICGETEDLQIDHVEPASLSSTKISGVLCYNCNVRKSDNDIESINKISSYIKNKLSINDNL